MAQKHIRCDDRLLEDISRIAREEQQSENQTIETALRFYRDYYYMQHRASIINDELLLVIRSICGSAEKAINRKTNAVLSELAIQQSILNQIIAKNLEISSAELHGCRLQAVEYLKQHNRVLRMDEVVE